MKRIFLIKMIKSIFLVFIIFETCEASFWQKTFEQGVYVDLGNGTKIPKLNCIGQYCNLKINKIICFTYSSKYFNCVSFGLNQTYEIYNTKINCFVKSFFEDKGCFVKFSIKKVFDDYLDDYNGKLSFVELNCIFIIIIIFVGFILATGMILVCRETCIDIGFDPINICYKKDGSSSNQSRRSSINVNNENFFCNHCSSNSENSIKDDLPPPYNSLKFCEQANQGYIQKLN